MSTPATEAAATTSATRPAKRPATAKTPAKAPAKTAGKAAGKAPARTAGKTAAGTKSAPRASATRSAPKARVAGAPLHEREPRAVATAAGLALTAVVADAVEAIGRLPRGAEELREEVRPIAERAPERLRSELAKAERALTEAIDARAPRGRAVIDDLAARPEVRELRDRVLTLRSRLQRALGGEDRPQA
jgi:hypothetical protein